MASSPSTRVANGSGTPPEIRSAHLSVHAINIYVRDQEASLRFYVNQLGFNVAFDAHLQTGDRWVAVSPPDGTAVLALTAPKPGSYEYELIGRPTGIVLVAENVIAKYAEWRGRGVHFEYAPRLRRVKFEHRPAADSVEGAELTREEGTWGGVFTHFRDLDGNSFALVGFDEVNQAIEAQRQAMAEKLEAERRAAQELRIAKEVQARLFPQSFPAAGTLEYAGTCIQARQVGGDYFDFLDLGHRRLGLVVGDVAGKGIAAALLMANLQANVRIQCGVLLDAPQHLLRSVNQVFHRNSMESAYATLFFAEYEDEQRLLRYANCGHLPALLLRGDDTVERLPATATVVGLFPEWDCTVGERALQSGDLLAVYTDGVTEAFNEADEEFGEERLLQVLSRNRQLPAESIVASVVAEVQKFSAHEQYDDITLIVAKCR
jgi:serine phosphatase RsbU (regulator of sigma subunit)/catechol 2,3-dioxygenase-like lactoylglutathione lyase family enzyme